MHKLQQVMYQKIGESLKRKSIRTSSQWAESYRVMGQPFPGKWKFDHHPWLREMHDCEEELQIGCKSAQMGYTETALNKAFKAIDIDKFSVLYVLPASNPDATDFSKSRFDSALDESEHLKMLFSDVKNVGHKRAGSANLFIRGSRSRSQLKSVPASMIICDELDEMVQSNIQMIFERSSGQLQKRAFLLSTPTIENRGISKFYRDSTQDHFFFKCPHCSKLTELTFPECLVITGEDYTSKEIYNSHLICQECKMKLNHETKYDWLRDGKWVSKQPDKISRGFYINQLYSFTVQPHKLAINYLKSHFDLSIEQEFWNSDLGLPHVTEGARITENEVLSCMSGYKKYSSHPGNSMITMGVDVGAKKLHVEIDEWFIKSNSNYTEIGLNSICKLIYEESVYEFEDLYDLMNRFSVRSCVIDANPERRKSLEFAYKFFGKVKLCTYTGNSDSKEIKISEETNMISISRTSWLDLSLSRFKRQTIQLPLDVSFEYRKHIQALVRIYDYKKVKAGSTSTDSVDAKPLGRYVRGFEDDHFAHARNYSEIALALGANMGRNMNI